MISIKYVRGDINANGADEIGINNGLIKISGNFTKMVRIIVLAGVSVGGTDNIKLKLEKAKAAMMIPIMMIKMFKEDHNPKMIRPKTIGIVENIQPKKRTLITNHMTSEHPGFPKILNSPNPLKLHILLGARPHIDNKNLPSLHSKF